MDAYYITAEGWQQRVLLADLPLRVIGSPKLAQIIEYF